MSRRHQNTSFDSCGKAEVPLTGQALVVYGIHLAPNEFHDAAAAKLATSWVVQRRDKRGMYKKPETWQRDREDKTVYARKEEAEAAARKKQKAQRDFAFQAAPQWEYSLRIPDYEDQKITEIMKFSLQQVPQEQRAGLVLFESYSSRREYAGGWQPDPDQEGFEMGCFLIVRSALKQAKGYGSHLRLGHTFELSQEDAAAAERLKALLVWLGLGERVKDLDWYLVSGEEGFELDERSYNTDEDEEGADIDDEEYDY